MFRLFYLKDFLFASSLLLIWSISYATQLVNKPGYSYPEKLSKNSVNSLYDSNSISIHPYQWNLVKYYNPLDSGQYVWRGDNFAGGWKLIEKHVKKKPGEGVVVAVIDSGYTPHPSFKENLLPLSPWSWEYGYNFIRDCRIRVDGPGSCLVNTNPQFVERDPAGDAFDYGDYLLESEIKNSNNVFKGYRPNFSSWHGTQIIGAIINTGTIAGGAYGAKVIPIRVIGKGRKNGGFSSIIEGLLWAAGISKPEIPRNLYPADVINLSLAAPVPCSPELQKAIDAANKKGSIIVASAGHDSLDVSKVSPANCKRVISVTAKGPDNKLVYKSNFGEVSITASGGNLRLSGCPNYICGIFTSSWGSESMFDPSSPVTAFAEGTSIATAHVSAAIANIISVLKARGETYDYNRIVDILQKSASNFAEGGNCYASENCALNNKVLDVGKAIELVLEKDLKKDYIFVNKGIITNHALARCPATVSIDIKGGANISKSGGDDKCISYNINNAKVYILRYSYTKDYLLAGTDQGLYVCKIKDVTCQIAFIPIGMGVDYISTPEININQLEEYHITIKGDNTNYIELQFKEDVTNGAFVLDKWANKAKNNIARLSDSSNLNGELVTN